MLTSEKELKYLEDLNYLKTQREFYKNKNKIIKYNKYNLYLNNFNINHASISIKCDYPKIHGNNSGDVVVSDIAIEFYEFINILKNLNKETKNEI